MDMGWSGEGPDGSGLDDINMNERHPVRVG